MRKRLTFFAAASVLLLFAFTASAQRPYERDRDDRYQRFGRVAIERVRADLNRAEGNLRYLGEGEMRRFQTIQVNLAQFQRKWERGRYDRDDLNRAIVDLRGMVDRGRLRPRDRDLLADDLRRLHELRVRLDRDARG